MFLALLKEYPDLPFLHSAYAATLQVVGNATEATLETQRESKLHSRISSTALKAVYANAAPTNPGVASGPSTADPIWAQAQQLFAAQRYAETIPALKTTIARQPNFGTAWAMLGLAEFERKDYDDALLHLLKGSQLGLGGSPDSVRLARYRLALLLIHAGRFDEANPLLLPEAEGNSLSLQIRFALGLALLHKDLFPQDVRAEDQDLVQSAGEVSFLLHNSKYDARSSTS